MKFTPLRILLIEDERGYTRLAMQALEGHERHVASSAAEGMRYFTEWMPDIIFLDIGLPDKNGLRLLAEMKQQRVEAYIIMLTASRVTADVLAAKDLGAAGYILKPFSRGKLQEVINMHAQYKEQSARLGPEDRQDLQTYYFQRAQEISERQPQDEKNAPIAAIDHLMREMFAGWQVLYVDESSAFSAYVAEILSQVHCSVLVAEDEILAMGQLSKHTIGRLMVTSTLNGGSSQGFCNRVRQLYPLLAISIVIDDAEEAHDPRWQMIGIHDFLLRPFKINTLLHHMEQALLSDIQRRGERYVV